MSPITPMEARRVMEDFHRDQSERYRRGIQMIVCLALWAVFAVLVGTHGL